MSFVRIQGKDGVWWLNRALITFVELEGATIYVNFPYARKGITVRLKDSSDALDSFGMRLRDGMSLIDMSDYQPDPSEAPF